MLKPLHVGIFKNIWVRKGILQGMFSGGHGWLVHGRKALALSPRWPWFDTRSEPYVSWVVCWFSAVPDHPVFPPSGKIKHSLRLCSVVIMGQLALACLLLEHVVAASFTIQLLAASNTRFRQALQGRAEPNSEYSSWKVWRLKQFRSDWTP